MSDEADTCVVGVDAGGTSTRCVVVTPDGAILGRARSAGANLRSSGREPEQPIMEVLREATATVNRAGVRAGVVGVAGGGDAGAEAVRHGVLRAWEHAGLPGEPRVVTDIEVAFASGTAAADGAVVIAGTGAVTAAIAGRRVVRRCDGYGWLLGDEGSAVWIGRAAVVAALAALDGRGPATALTESVTERLLGEQETSPSTGSVPQRIVSACYSMPPAALGLLAPLVADANAAGDAVARDIVSDASTRLLAALDAVVDSPRSGPVVLAGAVLASGPVAEAVAAGVQARGAIKVRAGSGAGGAAYLALRSLAEVPDDVHHRLIHT